MRHQDLTLNHRLESYVYADDVARLGAAGFVPGDVGRIAYQTDTGQYWRLTDDSPVTWSPSAGRFASLQTAILANPTSTTSTTAVMMGLGATIKITPTVTGKLHVSICGRMNNTTSNVPTTLQMWYGTGTAPVNGVAPSTGSAIGTVFVSHNSLISGSAPFNTTALLLSLLVGTEYWFDIAMLTGATGTAAIGGPIGTIVELP